MAKEILSDREAVYGCVGSLLLAVVILIVSVYGFNCKMDFLLVVASILLGIFFVQLILFFRKSLTGEKVNGPNETGLIPLQAFNECTELCSAFVNYMFKIQSDNAVMESLMRINGFEQVDRYKFGAFNSRIFMMVIHDTLKCYKSVGIYSGSDILCTSLIYHRSGNDPLECLDYSTAILKYKELCHLGDSVIRVVDTLGVIGFDGDTDFILAGALRHYGHDNTEYLNLLHGLASHIVNVYGLQTERAVRYPERILEFNSGHTQNSSEKKLNLDDLIGLTDVKREVRKFSDFMRVQQLRKEEGLTQSTINYHCVFTGGPGTGKTSVARILADVYKELGILKKGHLVETDRSGLVAEYVGQTAVKTNKIIDSALDGVLFIDEAYSLITDGAGDFGREAIATLLKRMEDDRDRLVVILAGYDDEMKRFIESNPGLRSRFNRYFHFPDYSAAELWEIFKIHLKKHEYVMEPEAEERVKHILSHAVLQKDSNFGNARYVRNLLEKILENQATRIAAEDKPDRTSLQLLTAADTENTDCLYKG